MIALCIGAVAGVLAAITSQHIGDLKKADYLLFIGAGYAGTDFIEGFITKYPDIKNNGNSSKPDIDKAKTPRTKGGQGGIAQ